MNKEELIGKLQMIYVGDRNALNELIGYYDGLREVIEIVRQENKKYKEVIDKAIELISKEFLCYDNESNEYIQGLKLIDILKEADKEVK